MNRNALKTGIVILLLATVAVVHHMPIHGFLGKHILHRELFFFPIVLAGLWFGLKAALLTSVAASIVYAHFFHPQRGYQNHLGGAGGAAGGRFQSHGAAHRAGW